MSILATALQWIAISLSAVCAAVLIAYIAARLLGRAFAMSWFEVERTAKGEEHGKEKQHEGRGSA